MIKVNQYGDITEINGTATEAETYSQPEIELVEQSDLDAVESSLQGQIDAINGTPPAGDPVFYKAAGAVTVTGTTLTTDQAAGCTVSRLARGRYQITFNNPANTATYPVLATMQGLPQNDDYQWAYLNRTINGFQIEIREQDNGGAAGVLRDSGFSFFVPVI